MLSKRSTVMEIKTCIRCKEAFSLNQNELSFYEKMKVVIPTICPECRFKQLANWRNEMSLYTGRTCARCGKAMLSMYNPKSSYTLYCPDCHKSEAWDARDYAQ